MRPRTTSFERLATSKPVDKLAGRQLGRGIEWVPNSTGNPHARKWDIPPQHLLKPMPLHSATFTDLTGVKRGRFTVIGYLGKLNPKKKAVWLCRCTCGNFETRGARAITSPDNADDACEACRYLERVKKGRGNSPLASPNV